MAIADDFSVSIGGDIRYTGGSTNYTVLELHRFLSSLADDAQAAGGDLIDITSLTPSDRSTDQIITLNSTYNIDDTAARHLYDGSITQGSGNIVYSGLRVLGTVTAGTEIMIVQDNEVLPAYWSTGINPDASNQVIMRLLIKSRDGGADIDGKRVMCLARELAKQYKEFPVTLGLANSVAAISTADDLNNTDSDTTIEAWSTIANTEGYQEIDIDGTGATGQEFYTKLDKGSQSLNQTYEFTKWVSQRSHVALSGTDTGTSYVIDNATTVGQAQSFTSRVKAEKLTEARFRIKIGAGAPTGPLTAELYASTAGIKPTGSVLATSEPVLSSLITSSYTTVIFRFNDNYTLVAATQYCIVIRHPNGGASDYFSVEGAAAGSVAGQNKANESPALTWTAEAAADLWFSVKSSPVWFTIPGEKFRGITHEIVYDNEAGGPFTEKETVFWGSKITYDTLVSTFVVGEYVKFTRAGVVVNGGKVLKDTGTILTLALETITANLLDDDVITGLTSGATAAINVTIVDSDKAGGEGLLLALDDNGATGDLYLQLISGQAPVNNLQIVGRTSAATCDVDTTVTPRTISAEFIGQSTGTNLIGAYGVGFDTNDVGASDKFFDLTNTQRTPPNNVTFTVTGLVSGEDRVLVGPRTASSLLKGQWLLNTTLNGAGETAIIIKTGAEASPIATDTPKDGTTTNTRLRVELDTGIYRRQAYVSYTASTFTIASSNYTGVNVASANNDVFCAYIDELANADTEAYTAVYKGSDRNILARVRDGGGTPIKTFEGNAVFGITSSSIAAIRTSDA
jgi:hypothetical protein